MFFIRVAFLYFLLGSVQCLGNFQMGESQTVKGNQVPETKDDWILMDYFFESNSNGELGHTQDSCQKRCEANDLCVGMSYWNPREDDNDTIFAACFVFLSTDRLLFFNMGGDEISYFKFTTLKEFDMPTFNRTFGIVPTLGTPRTQVGLPADIELSEVMYLCDISCMVNPFCVGYFYESDERCYLMRNPIFETQQANGFVAMKT